MSNSPNGIWTLALWKILFEPDFVEYKLLISGSQPIFIYLNEMLA